MKSVLLPFFIIFSSHVLVAKAAIPSGEVRYKYAVIIPRGKDGPCSLRFSNNFLHPGTRGVANTEPPK